MGLLDTVIGEKMANAIRQYVGDAMPGGLLNQEIATLPARVDQGANALAAQLRDYGKANRAAIENPTWNNVADSVHQNMTAAGMAPLGMTVWHGSPHKFDKFDMSKIGTGEGAQAYGHGLYMAESPDVAKTYLDFNGTLPRKYLADGELLKPNSILSSVADDIHTNGLATARINAKANGEEFLDAFNQLASKKITASRSAGSQLYKVDIPDEAVARFFDWDKPLSQQSEAVQNLAKQWNNGSLPNGISSGDEFLRYIQQQKNFIGKGGKAEDELKAAGIPGIRYLDGGSRSGGQGTSNFVLFDDQMPRILEVNGKATGNQPWKPGEWQGLLR